MINLEINRISDNMWQMNKIDLNDHPGVYFIYDSNKELIYIGQTKQLLTRTIQHFRSDLWFKLFAKYLSYREIDIEELRKEEYNLIQEFRPKYNFEHYCGVSMEEMREAVRTKSIL